MHRDMFKIQDGVAIVEKLNSIHFHQHCMNKLNFVLWKHHVNLLFKKTHVTDPNVVIQLNYWLQRLIIPVFIAIVISCIYKIKPEPNPTLTVMIPIIFYIQSSDINLTG